MKTRVLIGIFFKTGAMAFGGWSATALLLEKLAVNEQKLLTQKELDKAVAYAQLLPGATQVAIVASVGYKMRGWYGACIAGCCYLAPAVCLITLFAAIYFHFVHDHNFISYIGGLIAALGGLLLGNAYHIGKRHITQSDALWIGVTGIMLARLLLGLHVFILIVGSGLIALLVSWLPPKDRGDA